MSINKPDGDLESSINRTRKSFDNLPNTNQPARPTEEINSQLLDIIVSKIDTGLVLTDYKGFIEFANQYFSTISGYSNEELLGKNIIKLLAKDPENSPFYDTYAAGKVITEVVDHDILMLRKHADPIWERVHIQPIKHKNGQVKNLMMSFTSAANERNIKKKLILAKEHAQSMYQYYKAVLDAMPDLMFRMDSHGTYLDFQVSETAEKDLILPAHEMLGKTVFEVLPENNALIFYNHIQKTLETNKLQTFEDQMVIQGKEEYYDCRIVKSAANEVIAIIRNITERKTYEENLKLANERIKRSEKAKEMFLANTSHEIRTPMNVIVGLTELLKKTGINKKQKEYIEVIEQSSENLLHIINDILDMSKIESEKLDIEKTPFRLLDMIEDSKDILLLKAKEKGIRLEVECAEKCNKIIVLGDRVRLGQVLINLVNNAIKFTHEGFVKLKVEQVQETALTLTIRFRVIDSGIGIPPEKLESVFQEFNQADTSTTRLYGGTGLGLSISKQLVHLMGGQLKVKSEQGKGSEFYFTLEFQKAEQDIEPTVKTSDIPNDSTSDMLTGIRVLLVENHRFNRMMARKMLSDMKIQVIEATNGKEAIHEVSTKQIDVVLMDIQMPEMDGVEATRFIREHMDKPQSDIPIIALTAHALKGDDEKYKSLGMNSYLSKPYRSHELKAALIEVLSQKKFKPNQPVEPSSTEETALFDLSQLEEVTAGDKDFLDTMIQSFVNSVQDALAGMKKELDSGNMDALARIAHSIKPGFGTLGRDDLVKMMVQAESISKAGKKEEITRLINDFEDRFKAMLKKLQQQFPPPK